jgi:hypothetical protein
MRLMKRVSLRIFALMIVISGFAVVVNAQSGSTAGSVTGVVADEQGAVISGAIIKAKNIQTNLIREMSSGEDGSFLISQLPPGDYEFTVTAEGFTTRTSQIELELGTTRLINFAMRIGEATDVIEVNANSVLDQGKTESSTNNDRQRIDSLPINRRNFLDFTLTSARVVQDRVPSQGVTATSGLSFNGQPARFNNITIDGLENNDLGPGSVRATFSQDAVQEFQVVSDGYSAEFGRALGGVVNIVTRGGSNEFHGGLFLLNRNDSVSARNAFASINPPYRQYQFGATLGGPIKRDKSFFFTSFERLTIKQNEIVTISDETVRAAKRLNFQLENGPLPFSVGTTTFLGRFDSRLSPNDSFYVRYNFGGSYNGALETFGGLIGNSSAGIQKLDDNSIAVSNTFISPGLNLVNETRFLYGRRDQDVLPVDPGPQVRIFAPEGFASFGRGVFLPQFRQERIYQIVNNVALSRGRHQIKFGGDFSYTDFLKEKTNVPLFPGGSVTFATLDFSMLAGMPGLPSFTGLEAFDPTLRSPEQSAFLVLLSNLLPTIAPGFPSGLRLDQLPLPFVYIQSFGDTRLPISEKLFSAFIQDDIKLTPNLLFKAGLRYDINRITFAPNNNGNFSPRLALSYRPARLQQLNVHASYGLFFGTLLAGPASLVETTRSGKLKILAIPFPFSLLPFSMPGRRFPESDTLPSGVNFVPQLGLAFAFQPNLRNGYTQQISAGIDYFINGNTAVSAGYNFVRGIKLFSVRNINPVVRPIPGSPVASLQTGRVFPDRGDVNQFESAYDSYYHSLTLSINRRFANHFGFISHYTFSKAIDNFIDVRVDLLENENSLRPGDERGLSLQDVRHRLVFSGTWDLNYTKNSLLRDFQLSAILNLNTGRPYNLLAGQDLNMNGDANTPGDRSTDLGRNAGITPGFANFDLRLSRSLTIKDRYRLQGFIEAFNIFNRVNINEIDRTIPPDAQGRFNLPPRDGGRFIVTPNRFRSSFAPRQFQFGFRLML